MKVVFSRKGFDTGAGGGLSPIIDGRRLMPISASAVRSLRPAAGAYSRTICATPIHSSGTVVARSVRSAPLKHTLRTRGSGLATPSYSSDCLPSLNPVNGTIEFFGYLEVEEVQHLGSRPGGCHTHRW